MNKIIKFSWPHYIVTNPKITNLAHAVILVMDINPFMIMWSWSWSKQNWVELTV